MKINHPRMVISLQIWHEYHQQNKNRESAVNRSQNGY